MSSNKIKFWVENFGDLFKNIKILPNSSQSVQERMNSITRLIFIISLIILLFFGIQEGLIFLLISLVVIITVYYGKGLVIENFEVETPVPTNKTNIPIANAIKEVIVPNVKVPPQSQVYNSPLYILPTDQTQFSYNQTLADGNLLYNTTQCENVSKNQLLANGGKYGLKVNRNTLKPPVVIPRPYDFGHWRKDNISGLNIINEPRQHDKYRSGYYVQSCKGDNITPAWGVKCAQQEMRDGKKWNYTPTPKQGRDLHLRHSVQMDQECRNKNEIEMPYFKEEKENFSYGSEYSNNTISSPVAGGDIPQFPYTYNVSLINDPSYQQSGDINTAAGYNPENLKHNLPSNIPFGNCPVNPAFDNYNQNTYTQTIQPGYYNRSQIMDPISSNIGISFTQQFEPTTVGYERETNGKDGLVYTEHDPRVYKPERKCNYKTFPDIDNVYDPRYTGEGTSYRSYVDKLTGQPRFYYDDVDAIRRPNYVVRSKIDTFDYADKYGPMKPQGQIIDDDTNIREKVQDQFVDDSLFYRTSLQQSLMRKRNNEMSQLRSFPLSRANQGGCRRC